MSCASPHSLNTRLIASHVDGKTARQTPAPAVQRGSTILLASARDIYDTSQQTYGRGGLTTHVLLRDMLAKLENADDVTLYPSGLAAITGAVLALTSAGDEVLAVDTIYGPTRRFFEGMLRRFGVTTRYFAPHATADDIARLITANTRLIFLESPGSLTFEIQDVPAIAAMARKAGVLTVIDNSYAAGVLFKPLDHGVDVSVQALTKYVCGHSDVFMGMAAAKGPAAALLKTAYREVGWMVSPDDAYTAIRGLRTLCTRMTQHAASALTVANWMKSQPQVRTVLCPALPDDPNHHIWARDFSGINGLIGFEFHPEYSDQVETFLNSLKVFGLGYSWGGFESLAINANPQLKQRVCREGGETGPLIRLHMGLENVDDLIADLTGAFDSLGVNAESPRTDLQHANAV
jgi:cystathionine beta-lyase